MQKMGQTICFIPCCKSKIPSGNTVGSDAVSLEKELPKKWQMLKKARSAIQDIAFAGISNICFDEGSPLTSAIYLYQGAFYKQLELRRVIEEIQAHRLRLFILSAGYGVVDAFEPLQNYDAEMKGKVAKHWKAFDLEGIICEILLTIQPKSVLGFFAGNDFWSYPGTKYRYFFVEGLKKTLNEGLKVGVSGCFFRSSGYGTNSILGSLGKTFMDCLKSGFNESFIVHSALHSLIYGKVAISFKRQP